MESFDNNSGIDSIPKLNYYFADLFLRGMTSPLHVFISFSKTSIDKLPYNAGARDRSIRIQEVGKNIYSIKIRLRKRGASGWLVTKKDVWIFYIKAEESSSIVGTIVEDWLSGMSPFISSARIPPLGLFQLLDSLAKVKYNGLIIDDYLSRSFRHDRILYQGRKEWASQKGWPGEIYDRTKFEKEMSVVNNILYAVKVEFHDEKRSFTSRVSRNGHITFYKGQEQGFSNFYDRLVEPYIGKAIEYRNTLDNKEATITETEDIIHPLVFQPKRPLKIPDFDHMVDAVTAEPGYMVSIIHKGNPWLYLTIVDRADGNSCEVYGFEDEIQIIPQLKSTPEGLARLEEVVYDVFPNITKVQNR